MVRIRDVAWPWRLAAMLAGSRPASADPITLTGNVATDFTPPMAASSRSSVAQSSANGSGLYVIAGPDWAQHGANDSWSPAST